MRNMNRVLDLALELKFRQHQANAFNAGKEWALTYADYLKAYGEGKCAYSGVALTLLPNCPNTLSIERVDNMKGYVPGNVVFVCWPLNRAKSTSTLKQYKKECRAVARF